MQDWSPSRRAAPNEQGRFLIDLCQQVIPTRISRSPSSETKLCCTEVAGRRQIQLSCKSRRSRARARAWTKVRMGAFHGETQNSKVPLRSLRTKYLHAPKVPSRSLRTIPNSSHIDSLPNPIPRNSSRPLREFQLLSDNVQYVSGRGTP